MYCAQEKYRKEYFHNITDSNISLKESIEVDINRLKILLLYFYDTHDFNLREKSLAQVLPTHAERMPLSNFIIYCTKNRHSGRLRNSRKTFVNQWVCIVFGHVVFINRHCCKLNFLELYKAYYYKQSFIKQLQSYAKKRK